MPAPRTGVRDGDIGNGRKTQHRAALLCPGRLQMERNEAGGGGGGK